MSKRTWTWLALALIPLLTILPWGCGSLEAPASKSSADGGWGQAQSTPASSWGMPAGGAGFADDTAVVRDRFVEVSIEADGTADAARGIHDAEAEPADEPGKAAVAGRKLIRTGSISVAVDDYEPFQQALDAQIAELGGFVADATLDHWSGRVSYATLTVRVPAEQFDTLVGWTESQVEVQSLSVNTQDVTEEWVDVRSRIDNGKRTEARLLEILDTRTATLADVLAVEQELARVRGEIEAAEGRMRVLADQVGLATLTISVSVRNPYEPAVEAPGFGAQIVDAFLASIEAMVTVGKGLVIIAVAMAPWLVVMAIGLGLLFVVVRALVRRRKKA